MLMYITLYIYVLYLDVNKYASRNALCPLICIASKPVWMDQREESRLGHGYMYMRETVFGEWVER